MNSKKNLLFLFFLLVNIIIHSQKQAYIQYTDRDGIPSNNVYMGFQDSKGYMWFGTDAGLSRFDGYSFKNFSIQDGLPDNDIFNMLEDKQGRIWFATYNGKLGYFKDDKFHNSTNTQLLKNQDLNIYTSCLYEDKKGNIWFGSRLNRIKYLDTKGKFHEIPRNEFSNKNRLYIYAIWENYEGDIYALTNYSLENLSKKESTSLNDIGITLVSKNLKHCKIQVLDNGELLVTEDSNFYIIDKHYKKVLKKSTYNSLNTEVLFMEKGSSGKTWVGTYNGMFKLNVREEQNAIPLDFLNGLTISSRKEDHQGNIWFTTLEKGVYFLPYVNIVSYTVNDVLPEEKVNTVDGNNKGDIILGHVSHYSFIKDGKIKSSDKDPTYELKQIRSSKKHIYNVSLYDNGDYIIASTTGIIVNKEGQNNYYSGAARAAINYKNDSIVMGFSGLYKAKITETKALSEAIKIPARILDDSVITTLYWDEQDNSLWVGLINGLLQIKEGTVLNHSDKHPSLKFHVTDIKPSKKNNGIWVSTNGKGVLLLNKNGVCKLYLTTKQGLSSDICKALIEDETGKLWVASNNGLNKVIDEKDKNIIKYGFSDGLLSNNINDVFIHQNKVWVATPEGLSMMDISKEKSYITPIYITNTSVNSKSRHFNKNKNTLSYKENNISIDFVALDYNMGGEVLYRYKIKENQDWLFTHNNSIEFSSLSNGTYTFMVQAKNKQGIWSKESAILDFKITKPWWQTWWAIVAYTIVCVGLTLGGFQYESKKKQLGDELLSEKKESLRFKELDKFKSDFFTNISHEIRTPLTLINGFVSELDNNSCSLQDIQKKIKKQSNVITEMLDNVLDLAKMQSSDFNLQLKAINISELIHKQYLNFEPLFKQKNILLTISQNTEDYIVEIDIVYLEKAINNIIINALKYTYKGSVSITTIRENQHIHIIIQDTGIGILKKDLENVFNRFYQITNDINKSGGSGVGLAFSKEIIELHGGCILLKSEHNIGSIFTIVLPLLKSKATRSNTHKTPLKTEKNNTITKDIKTSNYNFLIVDDNYDMRKYLVSILKNYNCIEASDGLEALKIIEYQTIDFIITDYMMPKLNGYEFVTKLKENATTIPVIMLTAKTGYETRLSILKIGIDDYITKPFDKEELLIRIQNCAKNYTKRNKYNHEHNIKINPTNDPFIEELKLYIHENVDDNKLNQDIIAEAFNVSKSSFYRKVKSQTGLSPNNFINEIKLQKAREILEKNPTILLKQLALEVGFSHDTYFSKIYTKRFGVKPIRNVL